MPIIVSSPGQFATRNYLALPLGGSRFLISLSGVAVIDLTGQGPNWRRDVAEIYVDLGDVLTATGQTPKQGYHLEFALQQWTSLATPNAFTDLNQAVNFGAAVDSFQVDWDQGKPRGSIHMSVNIAARDIDTFLHRVGYMLMLVGDVVEVQNVG